MYIFGLNVPLVQILFFLALIYTIVLFASIILILGYLRKLEKMTSEETLELQEIEKLALEEKEEIQKLSGFTSLEKQDVTRLEEDIQTLEYDTETVYLKHFVPDIHRLQNYCLWAMKKGVSSEMIKKSLLEKGWKGKEDLVNMVVEHTVKYVDYYKQGGKLKEFKASDRKLVFSDKKGDALAKTPSVLIKTMQDEPIAKKQATSLPQKRKISSSIKSVEEEIKRLEEDLKKGTGKLKSTRARTSVSKPRKSGRAKIKKAKAAKPKKTSSASVSKPRKSARAKKVAKEKTSRIKGAKSRGDLLLGTEQGNRFHRSSCIVMKNVAKEKVITFKDKHEALKKGYKPCSVCSVQSS